VRDTRSRWRQSWLNRLSDGVRVSIQLCLDRRDGLGDSRCRGNHRANGLFGAARGVSDHRLNWLSRLGHGAHYL
jgi:hypothetical protein